MSRLAIVIIGRNEGARLATCVGSVRSAGAPVVYVDSGSTDDSVAQAHAHGAVVVSLAADRPFTAARGRNAGVAEAIARHPGVERVQFVDGDCEVVPGWLEEAERVLDSDGRVAAVAGRIRERHPERSVYNRVAQLDWKYAEPGEVEYCGGNAMMRLSAFQEVGGFTPSLIAGEEPDLCVRLRRKGWIILQSGHDMVIHDMNMLHFGEWWRRCVRTGWAYAEGASLHGRTPERHWVKKSRSAVVWGGVLPVAAACAALPTAGASVALLAAGYGALGLRVYRGARRRGVSPDDARLQASFTVAAKLPQAIGHAQFALSQALRKPRAVFDWRSGSRSG